MANWQTENPYLWPHYSGDAEKYWSAVAADVSSGTTDLNAFQWEFTPFIFPEKGGIITRLDIYAEGDGVGAAVDLGYAIFTAVRTTAGTIGRLGDLITSGVIATTDDTVGTVTCFTGESHIVPDQECWIGFGSSVAMKFGSSNHSNGLPGLPGRGDHPSQGGQVISAGSATPAPNNLQGSFANIIRSIAYWKPGT